MWQAPEAEAEPLDPLAAWFRVHFALLEERGTLVTQLEGAGPEVGVAPQHALPIRRPARPTEPTRRKHSRNYNVNEGRCGIMACLVHVISRANALSQGLNPLSTFIGVTAKKPQEINYLCV